MGPVNHGQNWKGWERSGQKGLIITINKTSTGDLPLIITISDTCKNQPKTLDFDNTINLSSLIVSLVGRTLNPSSLSLTWDSARVGRSQQDGDAQHQETTPESPTSVV